MTVEPLNRAVYKTDLSIKALKVPRALRVLATCTLWIALSGCQSGQKTNPNPQVSKTPPPLRAAKTVPETIPKFSDITQQAGISFVYQNSRTPSKYLLETIGSGCAFIDLDGDGWLDILFINGTALPGAQLKGRPTLALYRNLHNDRFEDVTHKAGLDLTTMYGMGVAVGDYDNDGHEDFYVSCVLGPSHLFHNDGNGHFKDVTPMAGVGNGGMFGTSCAWLDYDRDGRLDLFVCNYVRYNTLKDEIPCYAGERASRIYCLPLAYETSHCTLYHNLGDGRFKDVSVESGVASGNGKSLGVSVWDYDGDGWPDIFVANDTVPGFLFHNEHNGKFTDVGVEAGVAFTENGTPHSGMGIDAADPRNDGQTALVITNYFGQQTSFYTQTAKDLFREDRQSTRIGQQTGEVLGFGIFFFDFDNDGYLDLLQVNGHIQNDISSREPKTAYAEPTLLFQNNGAGAFAEVGQKAGKPFTDPIVGRGAAYGDINNDGKLDVIVTSNDGPVKLWKNETPNVNHWLTLHLIGSKSNRDGIGAIVTVSSDGVRRRTAVKSGSSYLSQSDLRPHFGLGGSTRADVEILWPSGTEDKLTDVPVDKIWTIREGQKRLE
jgi:hypothetical protein